MKFLEGQAAIGAAVLLLSVQTQASYSHLAMLEKRHSHYPHLHNRLHVSPRVEHIEEPLPKTLEKRDKCRFPTDAGLIAITPGSKNAGWALSPDQECKEGKFCPYACPPGQLMAQWDQSATSYTYPLSMNGGLYCDSSGAISKPFPNKPYCTPGTGAVTVVNKSGKVHAICQTVLPGNEAMLIPTEVISTATLAVPGPDYWCSTASHFYHNPLGTSTEKGCVWGDDSQPNGNWSPYVSGANTDSNGNTFAKIGWNGEYTGSRLASTPPNFGMRFECSGCIGIPCSIDPSVDKVNEVTSSNAAMGAGNANFCVITIPKGVTASLVIFEVGGSSPISSAEAAKSSANVEHAPTPSPSTTTPHTTTSSDTTTPPNSFQLSVNATTTLQPSTSATSSTVGTISVEPHVLFENGTSTTISSSTTTMALGSSIPTATTSSAPAATSSKSAAAAEGPASKTFSISALFVAAVAFSWL